VRDAAPEVEGAQTGVDDAGSAADRTSHAWRRLDDQLAWYERRERRNQRVVLPAQGRADRHRRRHSVAAGTGASAWITGSLGATIVVLEGVQQLFQFQQNWIRYRATTESLKHEKYLFLSRAGPYTDPTSTDAVLAERVEGLVTQSTRHGHPSRPTPVVAMSPDRALSATLSHKFHPTSLPGSGNARRRSESDADGRIRAASHDLTIEPGRPITP
jgi:hypothetical protein